MINAAQFALYLADCEAKAVYLFCFKLRVKTYMKLHGQYAFI